LDKPKRREKANAGPDHHPAVAAVVPVAAESAPGENILARVT
jgi:hypothetical protein